MSIRESLMEWRRKFNRGERMKAEDLDALIAMCPSDAPAGSVSVQDAIRTLQTTRDIEVAYDGPFPVDYQIDRQPPKPSRKPAKKANKK